MNSACFPRSRPDIRYSTGYEITHFAEITALHKKVHVFLDIDRISGIQPDMKLHTVHK